MDRKIQPEIQTLKNFRILPPVRMTLPNGIPLTVINAGEQEVVRIDVLFAGARWQQSQKLQALFTNRMLREGTTKYTAATIAEKLDYYGSWLELSSLSEYAYITVYSLNKYLAKTLEVVESMIKEPLFPEKEIPNLQFAACGWCFRCVLSYSCHCFPLLSYFLADYGLYHSDWCHSVYVYSVCGI